MTSACGLDDVLGHLHKGDAVPAADVVDLPVSFGRQAGGQHRLHRVVDVDVVPQLRPLAVHRQRSPVQGLMDEPVHDPVSVLLGALERPIRVGDPQDAWPQAVKVLIQQ